MFARINRMMRKAVLVAGGLMLILSFVGKNGSMENDSREGFQTEEFDDIW